MRILNVLPFASPKANIVENRNKNNTTKLLLSKPVFDTVSFGNREEENLKKLEAEGYKKYGTLTVYDENKKPVEGQLFLKRSYEKCVDFLVSDKQYNEIGRIDSSEDSQKPDYYLCSIVNQSKNKHNRGFFRDPITGPAKGSFSGVGRALYDTLENYLQKNFPNVKGFSANAISQNSWDFHKKIGFVSFYEDYEESCFADNMMYRAFKNNSISDGKKNNLKNLKVKI